MKVVTYLSFPGSCEEAFGFYAAVLGGRVGEIFRYGARRWRTRPRRIGRTR